MTVDEIRESAKSDECGCECDEFKRQIAILERKLAIFSDSNDALNDEIMELHEENENLRGQITALKFAIKQLTKR